MAPTLELALELLDCSKFVFPLRLERPRHQAVLWFDRIVLASSSLGVVARSLQAQLPLPLQCSILTLDLGHGRHGDCQFVGRESLKDDVFNIVIQAEGASWQRWSLPLCPA